MRILYLALLMVVVSGLAMAETGITITEKRLSNGDSESVVDNTIGKIKKVYTINLSKHHCRVSNSYSENIAFNQELNLINGEIVANVGQVELTVWVDAKPRNVGCWCYVRRYL